jgi:2-(1,2-epoxy-1,2-dihydrophenyl)acetyl-CoA isomerase
VPEDDRARMTVLSVPRTMTPDAMAELAKALPAATGAAIVLAGAGSAFCLGADLKWLGSLVDPSEGVARLVAAHHDVVRAMRAAPAPVITAVNGAAAGGGMSLALAGDYCLAAENATFTAAYFRLGLTPDGGNSLFLRERLGPAKAMELLLTNRPLSAPEARHLGLVAEVADGDLLRRAREVAETFAHVPAETLVTSRKLLDGPLNAQLKLEEQAVVEAARKSEFKHALEAFLAR